MRIILVRHGETEYNVKGLAQGWCDSPLTKKGIKQAQNAANLLAYENIDLVLCSDTNRAITTTSIINQDIEIHTDPRIREMHYGECFEAKPNWHKNLFLIFHPFSQYHHVGGENTKDVIKRFSELIDELYLSYPRSTILIVSHGGLLSNFIIRKCILDLIYKQKFFIFTKNASINILNYDGKRYSVECLNRR